jgi:hypothetical protein
MKIFHVHPTRELIDEEEEDEELKELLLELVIELLEEEVDEPLLLMEVFSRLAVSAFPPIPDIKSPIPIDPSNPPMPAIGSSFPSAFFFSASGSLGIGCVHLVTNASA